MSLQLAAQHLASKGRGPDTTLVHMTPREVAGLQAIAKAHGGSLSINPETGLPEAGFLSSILPMIAGVGLTAISGGAINPMMAGLLTGGATGMATGNLRKGLMAGLGAYGGAGMAGSIAGLGAVAPEVAAVPAVPAAPVVPAVPATPALNASSLAGTTGTNAITGATPGFKTVGGETFYSQPAVAPAAKLPQTLTPAPQVRQFPVATAAPAPTWENLKAGFSKALESPSKLMTMDNAKYGLAALSPMLMAESTGNAAPKGSGPNPYQFRFDRNRVENPTRTGGQGEYMYYQPTYTQFADGGTVQAMSDRNAAETFMSNGGQMFADGGATDVYNYIYDPVTKTFKSPAAAATTGAAKARGVYGDSGLSVGPGADEIEGANPDNMFTESGQLNPIASTLASIGNTFGITSPQQGAIQGLPGLITGNPLGVLFGAAVGNAVQGQNMLSLNNSMIQANGGVPIPGMPQPGQAGFVAALPGAMSQMTSNAASQINDEVNASLNAASAQETANAAAQAAAEINASLEAAQAQADAAAGPGAGGDATAGGVSGADVGGIGGDVGGGDAGDGGGDGGGDYAHGGIAGLMPAFARGGYNLGGYSDGGRLLRGPGDGVSDSIPATIADKRPARLADGEFVIPARIVSELGNGSTDAGARQLYAMMDRIQQNRAKTVGKGKVAVNSRSAKMLPA